MLETERKGGSCLIDESKKKICQQQPQYDLNYQEESCSAQQELGEDVRNKMSKVC